MYSFFEAEKKTTTVHVFNFKLVLFHNFTTTTEIHFLLNPFWASLEVWPNPLHKDGIDASQTFGGETFFEVMSCFGILSANSRAPKASNTQVEEY